MAVTLKEVEAIPVSYPALPGGLSQVAALLDLNAIWARIEAYTRIRYTARAVVWTVEGGGEWEAPLAPVLSQEAHFWGDQWEAVALSDSPYGLYLPFDGVYRIAAEVGGGDVPAVVTEAFRRLAEYLADEPERAGVSSYSVSMGGAISESFDRNPAWTARAMELSGAADLLRPYKRRH